MNFNFTKTSILAVALFTAGFSVCSAKSANLSKITMKDWQYNAEKNVYYKTGISYAANPKAPEYESMGIFVPGNYFTAKKQKDGNYSVKVNAGGKTGNWTAKNAPYVMPIETPGYMALNPPTEFSDTVSTYTDAGFIFVWAGARGRNHGAPAGVTDFKAAIRFTRFNKSLLPGDTARFFTFGMSGGGAQSAILGASGDSDLYTPYLKQIGAVMTESDAVLGCMAWCPITNLDVANEAYEWNMGAARNGISDFECTLSNQMAEKFAEYINELNLKDDEGNALLLEKSVSGIYQSGSYYEWIKKIIEDSLNDFLKNTKFPYVSSAPAAHMEMLAGGGGFGMGMGLPPKNAGAKPAPEGMPKGAPEGIPKENKNPPNFEERDNIARNDAKGTVQLSGIYRNPKDYVDALNANGVWVLYDEDANEAKITSVADFAKAFKVPTKTVGAFDSLNASQGENTLFGYGDGNGAHFDCIMAGLLRGTEYEKDYSDDLAKLDSEGKSVQSRLDAYNPMYFISGYYEGYKTSKVAPFWRIRTGIFQGDTAVSTEANLSQALKNYGAQVDFATVWGLYHVEAETSGTATQNFIDWVSSCL